MRILTVKRAAICLAALLALPACRAPQGAASPTLTPTLRPEFDEGCLLLGIYPGTDRLTVELLGYVPDIFQIRFEDNRGRYVGYQCEGGHVTDGSLNIAYILGEEVPEANPVCLERYGARVYDFAPNPVMITIEWEGGASTQTFQPDYELQSPNGVGCDPEWIEATVIMELSRE